MSDQYPKRYVKKYERTPHGYDGAKPTSRMLHELLPHVLQKVGSLYKTQPDVVIAAWARVIHEKFAPLTKAVRFEEGILYVTVKNSTLLSLLSTPTDKERLLMQLRKEVPGASVKGIHFRIG